MLATSLGFEFQAFLIDGVTWMRVLDPAAAHVVGYWSRRDADAPTVDEVARELEQKLRQGGTTTPIFVGGWDYWGWFVPEKISSLVAVRALDEAVARMPLGDIRRS